MLTWPTSGIATHLNEVENGIPVKKKTKASVNSRFGDGRSFGVDNPERMAFEMGKANDIYNSVLKTLQTERYRRVLQRHRQLTDLNKRGSYKK